MTKISNTEKKINWERILPNDGVKKGEQREKKTRAATGYDITDYTTRTEEQSTAAQYNEKGSKFHINQE